MANRKSPRLTDSFSSAKISALDPKFCVNSQWSLKAKKGICRPNEGDFEWWGMDSTKAEEESPSSRPLKVVFAGPAKHWTDAAPVGNSRLGAMIWGGVGSETLQFNDDTLWTSVPCDYTNPQTPIILSKVRKLVDDGQVAEASLAAK